jgi:hypothetical protein
VCAYLEGTSTRSNSLRTTTATATTTLASTHTTADGVVVRVARYAQGAEAVRALLCVLCVHCVWSCIVTPLPRLQVLFREKFADWPDLAHDVARDWYVFSGERRCFPGAWAVFFRADLHTRFRSARSPAEILAAAGDKKDDVAVVTQHK